jgi:hypothetical protein
MLYVVRNTSHNIIATWHNMGEEGGGPLMFVCCTQYASNICSLDFESDGASGTDIWALATPLKKKAQTLNLASKGEVAPYLTNMWMFIL